MLRLTIQQEKAMKTKNKTMGWLHTKTENAPSLSHATYQ